MGVTELDAGRGGTVISTDSGRSIEIGALPQSDLLRWLGLRDRGRWVCEQVKRQAERRGNLAIEMPEPRRPLRELHRRPDVVGP